MLRKKCSRMKKKILKYIKKKARRLLIILMPFILLLIFCCAIIDFFYFTFPEESSKDIKQKELKVYCQQIVEKYNKSNTIVNGKNVHKLSDSLKRDEELQLKWNDVYAIAVFYNSSTDKEINKKLLDDIAKELAPKFEYKTFEKTITTVKEIDERNKDGILTGRKIKVTDTKKENEILLTEADSPYGHYKYTYEKVTEKNVENGEESTLVYYRNTSNELIGEEYERLDKYLSKLFKHKNLSKSVMEIEREEVFMLSEGILNEEENVDWLLDGNSSMQFTFDSLGGIDIPPELMKVLMKYCQEYKMPPWLICGFIYRESSFNPNCVTVAYGSGKWSNLTIAEVKNNYSLQATCAVGLMQTTEWDRKAKALHISNPRNALSSIDAQIHLGMQELYEKIKEFSHVDTKKDRIDWVGKGWEEKIWRGCQAYNGGTSRSYAYSEYLRRPDKTGVFDMADKYKGSMIVSSNNSGGSSIGNKVVSICRQQLNKPYVWGATGPSCFDCSGLMLYCYNTCGISLPRTSEEQFRAGKSISKSSLQPGDLVFFRSTGTNTAPGHVGMYVGGGDYIHAPGRNKVVKIAKLATRGDYVGARRYTK